MDKLTLVLILCFITIPDLVNGKICREAVCEYVFIVRHDRTMTYRPETGPPYKVFLNSNSQLELEETLFKKKKDDPMVGKIVNASDVITGDGYSKNIMTINGMLPGPKIEVEEGAQVVVKVWNKLFTDGVTIHWHGMHQKDNTWMDGAAQVSQCPIPPYQYFTYRFIASPAGTHMYHAHNAYQNLDGLAGMLIVHKKNIAPPYHIFGLMVSDWFHVEAHTLEISNPFSQEEMDKGSGDLYHTHPTIRDYGVDGIEDAALTYVSGLINGRGRWREDWKLPLTTCKMQRDETVIFKMVNSGGEFSFDISIDAHKLAVVALDGNDIEKFEVDSIIIAPGETADFEVRANQPPAKYWIRAKTLRDHSNDGLIREVKAVFDYSGQDAQGDPQSTRRVCTANDPCKVLNCPFHKYPDKFNKHCYSIADMRSKEDLTREYGLDDKDVTELFLNSAFNWGSSINGRKYLTPNAPVFQKDLTVIDCKTVCKDMNAGCVCTATYEIPYNKTIQLVLSNLYDEDPLPAHHPMHMHGHNFAVLKIGYGKYDSNTGMLKAAQQDVICANSICRQPSWNGSRPKLNFIRPPVKDTLIIPVGGYAVVRYRSDNPGPWLYHCHAPTHNMEGMKVLLEEGKGRYPPPPRDFPRCESYEWTEQKLEEFQKLSMQYTKSPPISTFPYIEDLATELNDESNEQSGSKDNNGVTKNGDCPEVMTKSTDISLKKGEFVGLIIGCICIGVVLALLVFTFNGCWKQNMTSSQKEKNISKL